MKTIRDSFAVAAAIVAVAAFHIPDLAAQTVMKLAHDQPESSTHHRAALKLKEMVEARSKGQIRVNLFPSNLLGNSTQMVEQVQAGALEAAVLPTAWIAPIAPSVQVLDLPFLFPERKSLYQVVDGPVGAEILKPLAKVNIEGVAFWESGFKQFTGQFPIREPGDYKGRKIRTMPAAVIQEQFKAFGATPTTIAFSELYSALQQNVVDGQENPIASIASMRLFEVQKYMTISDHGFLAYVFMFSKPFLDRLPKEQKAMLVEAAREGSRVQRAIIQDAEKEHLETFRKAGVQITTLTPAQRAKFEQASRPVYDWFTQKYGGAGIEMIRKELAAIQKK